MKKAIVTGANGFVGSAVVRELIVRGIEVIALVHAGHADKLPQSPLLTVRDFGLAYMTDLRHVLQVAGVDTFYHFAWQGSAGEARADTRLQLSNVQWTLDALELAHAIGCRRFVGAGSIMEHEAMAAAYTQGHRPGPGYIYAGAKVSAHIMCMVAAAKLGIELVWPEITNAYGVGEVSPRMVNMTIRKCLSGENPHFTAGTQNYDFVYIDDVARAFYLIGTKGKPFHEYIIGSGTARPLRAFLEEMHVAIAPERRFIFGDIPFTGINLPLSAFDCRQTEQDTGFRAKISFSEGCRRTKEWLKAHM